MGFGILTGQAETFFDFLWAHEGNGYVVGWWGLMAAIFGLGTYWICFAGGAEMLELHPGVHMVPQWPASMLRLYWLGIVTLNLAVAAVVFGAFSHVPEAPGHEPVQTPIEVSWLPALIPLFLMAMWPVYCVDFSAKGGLAGAREALPRPRLCLR